MMMSSSVVLPVKFHFGKRCLTGRGFPSFVATIIFGGERVRLGGEAGIRVGE